MVLDRVYLVERDAIQAEGDLDNLERALPGGEDLQLEVSTTQWALVQPDQLTICFVVRRS